MTTPIPLAGVIGWPVSHSKSPDLHGYWLKKYGLKGHYMHLEIQQSNLAEVLKTMPKMGFVGANVTIPHKETVLGLADVVTDRAALIGAANTLIFRPDGKMLADNTDGFGFIENVRQNSDWSADKGPVLVLGAGGAARAVVASLLDVGVSEIRLTNRTRTRSEALRDEFGAKITVVDWVKAAEAMESISLLVNTTSLGMTGKPELKISLDALSPSTVVTDIVYTPLHTPLLIQAADRGCQTVDGLGMLIYQGIPGFERWFGVRPEVDEDLRSFLLGE